MALAYKRNPAHADKLLDKLTDYAVFHFKTEGDLIRKYAIDPRHTTHHFSAHKEFADSIGSIRALALWREKNTLMRPALGQSASQLEGELNNYNFEAALALVQAALDNIP